MIMRLLRPSMTAWAFLAFNAAGSLLSNVLQFSSISNMKLTSTTVVLTEKPSACVRTVTSHYINPSAGVKGTYWGVRSSLVWRASVCIFSGAARYTIFPNSRRLSVSKRDHILKGSFQSNSELLMADNCIVFITVSCVGLTVGHNVCLFERQSSVSFKGCRHVRKWWREKWYCGQFLWEIRCMYGLH